MIKSSNFIKNKKFLPELKDSADGVSKLMLLPKFREIGLYAFMHLKLIKGYALFSLE